MRITVPGEQAINRLSSIDSMDNPSTLDVSVVLPCFNEEGHIVEEIDRIRAGLDSSTYSCEIIVIDDGSTDRPRFSPVSRASV